MRNVKMNRMDPDTAFLSNKVKGTVIKDTWSEIRRRKGTANKPKAALVLDDIKKIMEGVAHQCVTPGALARRLLVYPGAEWIWPGIS